MNGTFLTSMPPASWQPEVFVNYGGFTLAPPRRRAALETSKIDSGLSSTNSILFSYIASGGMDIVVSQNPDFIHRLHGGLSRPAAYRAW